MSLLNNDSMYVILGDRLPGNSKDSKFQIVVTEDSKKYDRLGYTTNVGTLLQILKNQTFRSTSLSATKLNDQMEKKRISIEGLAHTKFITCFTHISHESVPFWCCYGTNDKEKKVQLLFKNFASTILDLIYSDYALINDGKKLFFDGDEYGRVINQNGIPGAICGLPKTHTDYELRSVIKLIQIFDIEYVPVDSDVFSRDYKRKINITLGTNSNSTSITCEAYDASVLGKQKSDPWDYEQETRIMLSTSSSCDCIGDWIDIRLKPEIFRGLEIIMSPWDNGNLEMEIREIINNCDLPDDIKNSIVIRDSMVKGTLNI